MAACLNKAMLIGNLTRDVDLRYTPSGAAVANFGLAINRTYTNSDGEKVDDVCYIDVVAWNRLAEVADEYLSKGRSTFVEGRLQMDSWEQEDGQKRSKLKVVAQNIQFLSGSKADDSEGEARSDDIPF
jgi:single-strand DNA-binding protein